MTAPKIATYVTCKYPGVMFSEGSTREVAERDPERIAREADPGVFAFWFFDVATTTVTVDGEDVELRGPAIRKSPLYYIDAVKLTVADVEALSGDNRILLSNMRCNGWETVVRCRTGNIQPLGPGDVLISSGGAS